ncbi:hypothetical protein QBC39DRAFT_360934 [Podospora conica]|nr:hypothetical protein QBC39DRAFT_360934 [Schizothecium conicum]
MGRIRILLRLVVRCHGGMQLRSMASFSSVVVVVWGSAPMMLLWGGFAESFHVFVHYYGLYKSFSLLLCVYWYISARNQSKRGSIISTISGRWKLGERRGWVPPVPSPSPFETTKAGQRPGIRGRGNPARLCFNLAQPGLMNSVDGSLARPDDYLYIYLGIAIYCGEIVGG